MPTVKIIIPDTHTLLVEFMLGQVLGLLIVGILTASLSSPPLLRLPKCVTQYMASRWLTLPEVVGEIRLWFNWFIRDKV